MTWATDSSIQNLRLFFRFNELIVVRTDHCSWVTGLLFRWISKDLQSATEIPCVANVFPRCLRRDVSRLSSRHSHFRPSHITVLFWSTENNGKQWWTTRFGPVVFKKNLQNDMQNCQLLGSSVTVSRLHGFGVLGCLRIGVDQVAHTWGWKTTQNARHWKSWRWTLQHLADYGTTMYYISTVDF